MNMCSSISRQEDKVMRQVLMQEFWSTVSRVNIKRKGKRKRQGGSRLVGKAL